MGDSCLGRRCDDQCWIHRYGKPCECFINKGILAHQRDCSILMSAKDWVKFVVLGLAWGASFLWIKIALEEIGPFMLVVLRLGSSIIAMLVFVAVRRPSLPPRSMLWIFILLGFFSNALPFALISWSEQYISSALAAILNSTVPLFTIIMAHIFVPDDAITPSRMLGLLVGFGGVVLMMWDRLVGSQMSFYLIGQVAMLAAACSYAVGAVLARLKTRGLTQDVQSLSQGLMAFIIIMPVAVAVEAPLVLPRLSLTWLAVLWLGVLGTAIAYVLYFSLIHSVGPTRTMLVTYVFPLVGVTLGVVILGEQLIWQELVGGLLIISGIVIVNSHLSLPHLDRRSRT